MKQSPCSQRGCSLTEDESSFCSSLWLYPPPSGTSPDNFPCPASHSMSLSPLSWLLQAPSPWLTPDPASVQVRLLWDVLTPDPNSCPPLYVLWRVHSESAFGLGWEGVGPLPRGLNNPSYLPFSYPGQIPQRVVWPGPVPASLSLALLESVLRHVGLNEVHKAVGLLLETLGPPPSGLHLQRYSVPIWEVCGLA